MCLVLLFSLGPCAATIPWLDTVMGWLPDKVRHAFVLAGHVRQGTDGADGLPLARCLAMERTICNGGRTGVLKHVAQGGMPKTECV